MTLRFGSIIVHKAEQNSEGESTNYTSGDDDTEIAEIAELAIPKYNKRVVNLSRADRHKRSLNKSRSTETRRSSTSSSSSSDLPILRAMKTDKSPPFVRSHYTNPSEDRLQAKRSSVQCNDTGRKMSSQSAKTRIGDDERLGFKAITSGSGTLDKQLIRRRAYSAVPDVTSSLTTPFVPIFDEEVANGLSKLLKNLNFTERLRQQKADQARLDINNLPRHMKEQLKHIYVY